MCSKPGRHISEPYPNTHWSPGASAVSSPVRRSMPLAAAPDALPDPAGARKPPRRLWLLAPYAALAALMAAYGGYWFVAAQEFRAALERQGAALRAAGWTADWATPRLDGFPFRLRARFGTVRLIAPSGWGVGAPRLEAQAYLHTIGHWVLIAPAGLTFARPESGAVEVGGEAIRASVAGLRRTPWRVVVQGVKLTFRPAPGAAPLPLDRADLLELYLRPAPDGGGDAQALLRLEGGRAAPSTALQRLGGSGPISAMADVRVSRAGGRAQVRRAALSGAQTTLQIGAGMLAPDPDGRLAGELPATLRQSPRALASLAEEPLQATPRPGDSAALRLVFVGGAVKLGAIRLGPAPKLF